MSRMTVVLSQDNVEEVDHMLDDLGIFAKPYTAYIDGELTVIGIRIGEKPGHIIAFWGDTITVTTEGQIEMWRGVNDNITRKDTP